ncbi:MAG: acyltransferase [Candidatus Sericytochromatia bacterium]|nr:acyltransferase [Candidatus Sericytochromatia bacterium]
MASRHLLKRCAFAIKRATSSVRLHHLLDAIVFRHQGNRVEGRRGNGLHLVGADVWHTRFVFHGTGNQVWLASDTELRDCTIEVFGTGHEVRVGPRCRILRTHIRLEDHGCQVLVGAHTSIEGAHLAAVEPTMRLTIGEGCMLSHDIDIRTSDSHAIYDAETGTRLNPPAPVAVGPGVWIGAHVQVLKGVTLGAGSVVGTRSLVTRSVPPGSLAAGSPASVLREGVTWTRER